MVKQGHHWTMFVLLECSMLYSSFKALSRLVLKRFLPCMGIAASFVMLPELFEQILFPQVLGILHKFIKITIYPNSSPKFSISPIKSYFQHFSIFFLVIERATLTKVIIWIILVVPEYTILQTKFWGNRSINLREETIKLLIFYGHDGHVCYVPLTVWGYIRFFHPKDSIQNLVIGPVAFEKMF